MARIRTIKPQFFIDQDIAALHPLTRQLFLGLLCLSDRRGRLDDKPGQIKVQTLPYDNHNIDEALKELSDAKFITRYQVDGKNYIEIRSFEKHQHCHIKEPESTIPAPCLTRAKPVRKRQEGKGREQEGKGTIEPEVPAPVVEVLPEGIDVEVWSAFEEMRKTIRKPMTDRARQNIISKLESFKAKGHDPTKILDASITNSWQDVYEPKEVNNGQRGSGVKSDNKGSKPGKYSTPQPGDMRIVDGVETVY